MTDDEPREQERERPASEAAPAVEPQQSAGPGGGLRLLGALVTLPWLLVYGVTGVWAVALAARAAGEGLKKVDAGYTRFVTPAQLALVGALLLAAFAVLLGCGLLLLFQRRSRTTWLPLLVVAGALTAGAAWAGVRGGLHPLLWGLFFLGLVYVTVIALVRVAWVTRPGRSGRMRP